MYYISDGEFQFTCNYLRGDNLCGLHCYSIGKVTGHCDGATCVCTPDLQGQFAMTINYPLSEYGTGTPEYNIII